MYLSFSQDLTNQNITNQNTTNLVSLSSTNLRMELSARVVFFNKKQIDGRIIFKSNYVVVNHVENSVRISLSLKYSDIEMIHPITWFPEFQKIEKDRLVYNFYPVEYVVKLKDGKYLNVVGRVPEFEVMDFVYSYGKSKIYTYFVDYLISDKKGFTKWKNMGTYELNKNFKKPHPNVAYYVYFR